MAHIKHSKSQEKLMDIMSELLKIDDNKYCVDCGSKGPRWASCTFGVFLCIRCAGIHRNMGVHISRIKSVDYDIWTSNQVDMMKKIGNSYGRVLYEANLDNNFLRPETDYALDKFIRSKYEHKLYIMKEQIPPTATVKERRLKQNPNDKKVNSRTRENIMILSNKKNIVTPISVKIMKKCHTGSATERFTVSSSANNSTFANNIDPESNSSTLSNINGPMNNLMNPRSNSLFQPEMAQKSDNVVDNTDDDFGDFISATQPPIIIEPIQVSSSEENNTTVNYVGSVHNSSNINTPICQNNLTHSNFELQEFAMGGNNYTDPGQINTNNIFTNNSEISSPTDVPMSQNSDNVTDNDDFVSIPQPSISNYQTSTGSATELCTVSYSENSNVTVNTIGQIPYSSNFINNNAPVCQNSLMQSGYEMSESNHMVPGQINANNIVPLQQIINNFMFLGQSVISLTTMKESNSIRLGIQFNAD